jgi:hypothetical protein
MRDRADDALSEEAEALADRGGGGRQDVSPGQRAQISALCPRKQISLHHLAGSRRVRGWPDVQDDQPRSESAADHVDAEAVVRRLLAMDARTPEPVSIARSGRGLSRR